MDKIREVYEKYKHVDLLLSDEKLMRSTAYSFILYRLWQTIKEVAENEPER